MKFVHVIDKENLGDQVCCPKQYFPWPSNFEEEDIRKYSGGPGIFGGGGLLHPGMDDRIKTAPRATSALWSIGSNYHDKKELSYPDWLKEFGLFGCRDWGSPFPYLPCPSCLNDAFEQQANPIFEAVMYEHNLVPIDIRACFPKLGHNQNRDRFPEIIRFLLSGRVVLTNSYHGAYWALLCGRPVVIYRPFSSRFLGLKPKVEFADGADWRKKLETASTPDPGYLDECRKLNIDFYAKVGDLLTR